MCHIVPQPKTYLQYGDSLNPENWRNCTPINELLKKVKELENSCVTEFQRYRGLFIEEMIECIVTEQKIGSLLDYVDIAVANEGKINTCSKCSNTYSKEISICPSCQLDANNYPQSFDPYYRTDSKHPVEKPIVHIGEPCMVNPNSFESLKNVLIHVSATNKLGKNENNRKWTLLICDGVPYTIASNLQDKYLFCNICKEEIKNMVGIEELEKTKREHAALHQNKTCTFHNLFHNIILLPGPGHTELNMGCLSLKLLWVPFLNKIVKLLGFRTEKAQSIVKNGTDHHRTRQILSTCLFALSKELLVPYVQDCQKIRIKPMNQHYLNWVHSICGEQYMFLYHITFSYLLAFSLYTEATHKNNSMRMMPAQVKLAPLFYSFKHPKYQQYYLRDLCDRVQMPDSMKSYVERHESFSVSNFSNHGQGGDFIQEEANKTIKLFLLPGMPSSEIWKRVCRKAATLKELKESVCDTTAGKT